MDTCIFCKILKEEIPNYTVYQDEHCLAFLDINPVAKGHTLVIPRIHAETLFELPGEEYSPFLSGVENVMLRLKEVLSTEGFTVGWNHGKAGQQAVPHLHMHVLPRWIGDGGGGIHAGINNPGEIPVQELAPLFK